MGKYNGKIKFRKKSIFQGKDHYFLK